ncbi:helix-turn-helix domain-containing protein [Streptomyces uncialis]
MNAGHRGVRAADGLHVHPHTFRYRLKRVVEIS